MTKIDEQSITIKHCQIVVLPGDHVGKEVTEQAVRVLDAVLGIRQSFHSLKAEFVYAHLGGCAIDQCQGQPFPDSTRELIDDPSTVAILLGAVGGPEWPPSASARPEQGILALRKHLNSFVNVRPCVFPSKSLESTSSLKQSVVEGVHFCIMRELCGGIYFGQKTEAPLELSPDSTASDLKQYSVAEIQRIGRVAALYARDMARTQGWTQAKVTSIDKANVLASSRLWKRIMTELFEQEFPDVHLSHMYVDAAAMHMMKNPRCFNGVVVTSNLFGDILSDQASAIVGSLGLLPSASLNGYPNSASPGLYEPIHGSAPDISGRGIANPIGTILSAAMLLRHTLDMPEEAQIVEDAVRRVLDDPSIGGFGLRTADLGGSITTVQMGDKVCEVVREMLGAVCGQEHFPVIPGYNTGDNITDISHVIGTRRPMGLCEKILANHAIGLSSLGHVAPNDMICVKVDWTMASELTWKGMEKTYLEIGEPDIWRNDRFWLAIDHTVDPSINHEAKPKALIASSEAFAKRVGLKDFHGPNQTILHTEFYRQRVQPGQLVIGADSHSCAAGALGSFAVGLGAADVLMPLVTGETWFKVPEICNIRFVGEPPFGIGGKDVILWVLGELKRNTVAFERAVEFTGPGCKFLSCDARFAISNMTTEFGGIAGVFEADEITAAFIDRRERDQDKSSAVYFRADFDAQYAETHTIDLAKVTSMVALYPSPDNVVPVETLDGMKLDGVFIGACTTTEEDLILASLVLEQGLKLGWVPTVSGKRKVTPGSVSIHAKLRRLGLIDIYESAGFEIGVPGCSYCLGIAADKASEGEVWLSSQNRNFKNRMGKGSIGNLASASTVAASSFDMKVKSPQFLLDRVDREAFARMCGSLMSTDETLQFQHLFISEPSPQFDMAQMSDSTVPPSKITNVISGKVQFFGHNVDTDAIIPAEFMPGVDDVDLGTHCFQYVRPGFREKVLKGYDIIVAGAGFGSGSSREEAPRALNGCGVKAVIAKSFAFIYGRNQCNMALLGIIPRNFDDFYETAKEGSNISINVGERLLIVKNEGDAVVKSFEFDLSRIEERLISGGGVTKMYQTYGKSLFQVAIMDDSNVQRSKHAAVQVPTEAFKGGLVGMVYSDAPYVAHVKSPKKMSKSAPKTSPSACEQGLERW